MNVAGEPVFVTVRTGLFGMSESFAPLPGASLEESVIRVAFAKDTVKNGPRIDIDRGAITETQELYSYYGLDAGAPNEGSATGSGPDDSTAAAGDAMPTQTTADAGGNEGRTEAAELQTAKQRPPHPLPHGGPPRRRTCISMCFRARILALTLAIGHRPARGDRVPFNSRGRLPEEISRPWIARYDW